MKHDYGIPNCSARRCTDPSDMFIVLTRLICRCLYSLVEPLWAARAVAPAYRPLPAMPLRMARRRTVLAFAPIHVPQPKRRI